MDHKESYEALLPIEEEAWLREFAALPVHFAQPPGERHENPQPPEERHEIPQSPGERHEIPQPPEERHVAEIAALEPDDVMLALDQLERIEQIKKARASGVDCEEEDWGQEADALAVLENLSLRKINKSGDEEPVEKQDQDGLICGIIIVGGLSVGNAEVVRQSTVVHRLAPLPARSSTFWAAQLPDGLYDGEAFATCTACNVLYFSGGNEAGDAFACYDPMHDAWSLLPSMPRGRRHHSIAAFGPWVFVIGGCTLTNENLDIIDAYDSSTQRWYETWCTMNPLHNISSVALRDCIYIFGSAVDDSDGCCQVQVLEMVGTEPFVRSGFQPLRLNAETIIPLTNQSDVYLLDRQSGAIYNINAPREGVHILIRKMKQLMSKPHIVQGVLLKDDELFTIGVDGVKEKLGHLIRRPLNFPPPFGCQAQLLSFPMSHFPVLSGERVAAFSCKGFWVDRQIGWEPLNPSERALQEAMLLSLQDHPVHKEGGDNLENRGAVGGVPADSPIMQTGWDHFTALCKSNGQLAVNFLRASAAGQGLIEAKKIVCKEGELNDCLLPKWDQDDEEELGAVGGVPADSPIIQMGRNHFAMAALLASNEPLAVASLRASAAGLGLTEAEEIIQTYKEKGLSISSLSEEDQTAVALLLSRMQPPATRKEENADLD